MFDPLLGSPPLKNTFTYYLPLIITINHSIPYKTIDKILATVSKIKGYFKN
tara:strand:- start:25 stop:177 length:153 start_codon:yes stop_codon:yes gene_type:complete